MTVKHDAPDPHDPHATTHEAAKTDAAGPKPEEFPKMLYDPDGAQRIVGSREEQDKLGGDWSEKPHDKKADKADKSKP